MEKYIPIEYLKLIGKFAIFVMFFMAGKEVLHWYLEQPREVIETIDCKHVITGEKPFLFHGTIVHQEHFVAHDY